MKAFHSMSIVCNQHEIIFQDKSSGTVDTSVMEDNCSADAVGYPSDLSPPFSFFQYVLVIANLQSKTLSFC